MKHIVYLDAGHGDNTPGKRTPIFPSGVMRGQYMNERTFNDAVVLKTIELLKKYNVETVYVSSTGNPDVTLSTRTNTANTHYKKALVENGTGNVKALFVSIHANAFTGNWGTAHGIEVFYQKGNVEGQKAADLILKQLITATKLTNRGIKNDNLHITRESVMPAVLCECGFMDNLTEASLLITDAYRQICAEAIVKGVISYLGLSLGVGTSNVSGTEKTNTTNTALTQKYYNKTNGSVTISRAIVNMPCATISQCKAWAKSQGGTQDYISNADIYFKQAIELSIDPVFAYVQHGLESGYGKYKGVVPSSYHNPCGLKTGSGGADDKANAHVCFKNWEDGISAHLDHIALYAGKKGYPKANSLDQRQFKELTGKGAIISTICKSWCPGNAKYADTIKNMMNSICKTKTEITYEDAVIILYGNKIINSPILWLSGPQNRYVEDVIRNIGRVKYGLDTYEKVIEYFVNIKLIDSPSIWQTKSYRDQHIKSIFSKIASLF